MQTLNKLLKKQANKIGLLFYFFLRFTQHSHSTIQYLHLFLNKKYNIISFEASYEL